MATKHSRTIFFDPSFDRGAWPGPLLSSPNGAVFGDAWLGPNGFLGTLETALGLGGDTATNAERECYFAGKLTSLDGYWRASYEVDPRGVAARLLADRDALCMGGWSGQPVSARLSELWNATLMAGPGIPDRLRHVRCAIAKHGVDLAAVRIAEDAVHLPASWQAVLRALADKGIAIETSPITAVAAHGDLNAARSPAFAPTGDGTLSLLRSHGPLAAAEEVAAWLAQLPSLDNTVIVGADALLDDALSRHGLPRTGKGDVDYASTALIRLVAETAFEPMDPAQLHALLCMDPGPIPRTIARLLASALCEFPGRGTAAWRDARANGLSFLFDAPRAPVEPKPTVYDWDSGEFHPKREPPARVEARVTASDLTSRDQATGDQRALVDARLTALLDPVVSQSQKLPLAALQERYDVLGAWARDRAFAVPSLRGTADLAERIPRLAQLMGFTEIGRDDLRRLFDGAHVATPSPAEAGLSAVDDPGAVAGPADTVVWWNFTRTSAPRVSRLRLTDSERDALQTAGVTVPDPGAEMAAAAARWRRPLTQARSSLLLVCPQTSPSGEPAHPHPLWDELCSAMTDGRHARRLQVHRPTYARAPVTRTPPLHPLPLRHTAVQVPSPVPFRKTESPSGLGTLLGCSLSWTLKYHANLYGGMSSGPGAPSPLHFGKLAHELLAKVFANGALSPDAAATRAEQLCARDLVPMCESLGLPRYRHEQAQVRHAIVESARGFAQLLQDTGATLVGVEHPLERTLPDFVLAGRTDALLANPHVVIDFKWGEGTNRAALEQGTALQLAAYAELANPGSANLHAAYFILRTQKVIAHPGTPLSSAGTYGVATFRETWDGAVRALASRRQQLAKGELRAPGALNDPKEPPSMLQGGVLKLAPGCTYCDMSALCGRGGGQ